MKAYAVVGPMKRKPRRLRSLDSRPEAAVAAWRGKVDNCARYMLQYLEAMTGRRQDLPGRSVRARPSGRGSD